MDSIYGKKRKSLFEQQFNDSETQNIIDQAKVESGIVNDINTQPTLQDIIDKAKVDQGSLFQKQYAMQPSFSAPTPKAAIGRALQDIGKAWLGSIGETDIYNKKLEADAMAKDYATKQANEQATALADLKAKAEADKKLKDMIFNADPDSVKAYKESGDINDLRKAPSSNFLSTEQRLLNTGKYTPSSIRKAVLANDMSLLTLVPTNAQTSKKGYGVANGQIYSKDTGEYKPGYEPIEKWTVVPGSKGAYKMNAKGEVKSITNADYAQPGETIAPERLNTQQQKTIDTDYKTQKTISTLDDLLSPEKERAVNMYGGIESNLPNIITPRNVGGTDSAGVKAIIDYLGSTEFTTNIEALRGLGAMSNIEGSRTMSLTELIKDPNTPDKQRMEAIIELRGMYKRWLQINRERNPNLPFDTYTSPEKDVQKWGRDKVESQPRKEW